MAHQNLGVGFNFLNSLPPQICHWMHSPPAKLTVSCIGPLAGSKIQQCACLLNLKLVRLPHVHIASPVSCLRCGLQHAVDYRRPRSGVHVTSMAQSLWPNLTALGVHKKRVQLPTPTDSCVHQGEPSNQSKTGEAKRYSQELCVAGGYLGSNRWIPSQALINAFSAMRIRTLTACACVPL